MNDDACRRLVIGVGSQRVDRRALRVLHGGTVRRELDDPKLRSRVVPSTTPTHGWV